MKKSVLLVLLFCWNQVCGHWLRCSTGVVITNQAISLPSSTHAGAKVLLLRKYQAPSLIDCIENCCAGKYGLCSVVEYKNKSADANCLYYSCQPIRKCKFMDTEGTDTFTFPSANQKVSSTDDAVYSDGGYYDKVKDLVLKQSAYTHHPQQRTSKDHSRAVTARKGVESFATATNSEDSVVSYKDVTTTYLENGTSSTSTDSFSDHIRTVAARKGVEAITSTTNGGRFSTTAFDEDVFSKSDSSFKNDNTTIKPRKGVDSEAELVSAKIKARKGVEVMHSSESSNAPEMTRSKVKPRKGAVPLPFSLTTTPIMNKTSGTIPELSSPTLAPHTSIRNLNLTLLSHMTPSTDLMSVLEQVFRDESSTPSTGSRYYYSTPTLSTSTINSVIINSTPVSSVKYNEYTTLHLNSSMSDLSSESGATESPLKPFHTVLPSKSPVHYEKVLESTPSLTTVTEQVKHQPVPSSHVSGQIPNSSYTPVLQTSMNSQNSVSDSASTHHADSTVLLLTISSPNKVKMSALSNEDESESERKYKSSMHLVLSLVFGLLVLFVVIGAVAKRIYDVWMRRHYHRMDFLIDGMYDGFS